MDFVKDNGHCNSQYGAQPDKYQVIEQGIPDHDEGIFCAEKEFKVFKTAPRTAIDAVSGVILSERDLNAKHGYVAIDKQIDDARHEHQIMGQNRFSFFLTFFIF